MAKFPYGGFGDEGDADAPWLKLATIREYLEDGEPRRINGTGRKSIKPMHGFSADIYRGNRWRGQHQHQADHPTS